MPDNTQLSTGTGGDVIRDEDVGGGIKVPVSKIYTGPHGVDGGPATLTNPFPVMIGDGVHNDAFGRFRVSSPFTIFDSVQQYGDYPIDWETQSTGAGAGISNLLNESTIQMTTGAVASGNKVVRQTRLYHHYQPGKSQMLAMTMVFDGGPVSNVRRRAGYFDEHNGIFLEQSGSATSFVRRSFTSGAPVDSAVAQASWNVDRFDGSGPSGFVLDLSKTQILVLDLQWLGSGRVRIGFDIDGIVFYAHEFLHANALSTAYMSTANLPVRFELENVGTAGSVATLRQICTMVTSEGGVEVNRAKQYSASNGPGGIAIANGSRRPLVSLRAKTTGPNAVRNTSQIWPRTYSFVANGPNAIFWEVVLDPASLDNVQFEAFDPAISIAEFDMSATAIEGGTVIDSGMITSNAGFQGGASSKSLKDLILAYSGLLGFQNVITLVGSAPNGNTNGFASFTWLELW